VGCEKQIPCGNDRKKSKRKSKNNSKNKSKSNSKFDGTHVARSLFAEGDGGVDAGDAQGRDGGGE
jgi:hypothetical protein